MNKRGELRLASRRRIRLPTTSTHAGHSNSLKINYSPMPVTKQQPKRDNKKPIACVAIRASSLASALTSSLPAAATVVTPIKLNVLADSLVRDVGGLAVMMSVNTLYVIASSRCKRGRHPRSSTHCLAVSDTDIHQLPRRTSYPKRSIKRTVTLH